MDNYREEIEMFCKVNGLQEEDRLTRIDRCLRTMFNEFASVVRVDEHQEHITRFVEAKDELHDILARMVDQDKKGG